MKYIRHADTPSTVYNSGTIDFEGDLALRVPTGGDGSVRVRTYERGVSSYPRRVFYTDPDTYVPGNPYQSIINARAKIFENWGTPNPYGRAHGEIILPPGNLGQLSNALEFNFWQNLTIIGHGMNADEVGPGSGGYGTTTITAPNSGWGIRIISTGGGNYAGPRIENLTILSGNGGGGGIYCERTSNGVLRHITVDGFTTGYGIHMYNNGNDNQYWAFDVVRANKCLYGIRMQAADATMNHCLISGNRNGADAILPGSIGLWEYVGSNRTNGLLVQGCDTLIQSDSDHPSFHNALRLEDFVSYGINITAPDPSNHGYTAFIQSINNYLGITQHGATADVGIQVGTEANKASIKNAYFFTRHYYATNQPKYGTAAITNDTVFGNNNRAWWANN